MSNKQRLLQITSTRGEAFYAFLREPEQWKGKPVGYTIKVKFPKRDTDKLINQLEAVIEKAKELSEFKGKKWVEPYNVGQKEDKNGDILFKFKAKHEYVSKTGDVIKRTVPVYDSKGNLVSVSIGNGSIVKVCFLVKPYWESSKNNGLTLMLESVQVLELKEYGKMQKGASAYGFDIEDDGFTIDSDVYEDDSEGGLAVYDASDF